jgi:hypothetical protein
MGFTAPTLYAIPFLRHSNGEKLRKCTKEMGSRAYWDDRMPVDCWDFASSFANVENADEPTTAAHLRYEVHKSDLMDEGFEDLILLSAGSYAYFKGFEKFGAVEGWARRRFKLK